MKNNFSPKLRFEVFRRDRFLCQMCHKNGAPDAVLHVEHIIPISDGGTNDITNLITICTECNHGKGARRLSENAANRKDK